MKTSFIIRINRECGKCFMRVYNVGMPTSKKVASQAGKDLRDPKTPKKDRGPIASDLAQVKKKK